MVIEPVERRDIALTIEATGTVEPIDLVEVKSKASGQIVRMPVQVGSTVRTGELLAQIDTRDVQNQYDQTARGAARGAGQGRRLARAEEARRRSLRAAGDHRRRARERRRSTSRTRRRSWSRRAPTSTSRGSGSRTPPCSAPIAGTVLEQLGVGRAGDLVGDLVGERRNLAAQDGRPRAGSGCARWSARPTSATCGPARPRP